MFWLFSLISHALIITQLPIIFTVLLITFCVVTFSALAMANYLVNHQWQLWKLFKACLLATVLSFIALTFAVYGLQQIQLHHLHLAFKPMLAVTIISVPCVIWLSALKYYLKGTWLRLMMMLLVSALNGLALLLLLGHLAKWATNHGYYASQLFL